MISTPPSRHRGAASAAPIAAGPGRLRGSPAPAALGTCAAQGMGRKDGTMWGATNAQFFVAFKTPF